MVFINHIVYYLAMGQNPNEEELYRMINNVEHDAAGEIGKNILTLVWTDLILNFVHDSSVFSVC